MTTYMIETPGPNGGIWDMDDLAKVAKKIKSLQKPKDGEPSRDTHIQLRTTRIWAAGSMYVSDDEYDVICTEVRQALLDAGALPDWVGGDLDLTDPND